MTDSAARGEAPHGAARFAGLIYAVVVASGLFSLAYAPGRIYAGGADAELLQSIAANEGLLRLSVLAEFILYTAFVALPLALYRLLAREGQFTAMLMAALAIASVPIGLANLTHLLEILRALDGGAADTAQSLVMTALERYRSGLFVQSLLWGLWLFPLGVLVVRCSFLPGVLGLLLILGGFGYLGDISGRLLLPEAYKASGLAPIFAKLHLSEILFCLWLVVFGARRSLLPRSRS